MNAFMEDQTPPAGSLLPPATTQRAYARPEPASTEPRIAPPFVARPTAAQRAETPPELTRPETNDEAEFLELDTVAFEAQQPAEAPVEATEAETAESEQAESPPELPLEEPDVLELAPDAVTEPWEPQFEESASEEEDHRWEELPDDGVVEPAFEADTDAALEALTQQAAELARRDDFPLDAFIVPEQVQHVPNGLEGVVPTPPPPQTPVTSLAERLEKLSHRLRVEDTQEIVRQLAAGDRLDTLLAGLLAGYLAGHREHH